MKDIEQKKVSKYKIFFILVLFFVLDTVNQVVVVIIEVIKKILPQMNNGKEISDSMVDIAINQSSYGWYGNIIQIMIIVLILYLLKRQGVDFFKSSEWNARQIMTTIGLAVGCVLINTLIDELIIRIQPQFDTVNQLALVDMFNNSGLFTMFVMLVILAPIAEEIMIRGIFIGVLFREKPYLGLIVSSLVFSFLHGPTDVLSFITYVVPGLTLGLIYIKTDRLITPIVGHMLNNLLGFISLMVYY